MLQTIGFALAATFAGVVAAQPSAVRPDPADAKAAVVSLRYDSAFKDYRPHADPEIARWREVNKEMGRLGGHAGHLPQAAPRQPSPTKPPTQAGHGEHR